MEELNAKPACDSHPVEFDIHGVLGVRLVDASPSDVAAVRQQLGALEKPLLRAPDLTLRFVTPPLSPPSCHLGFQKLGFTDHALFVFEEGSTGRKVRIPFEQLGGGCEIVCESGLLSVPLVKPILSLTALAKGFAAIHASAFVYNGIGVLMAGWAESGKTTALLGYAGQGAEFIGEDWVLLSCDGQKMCGLPAPVELSAAQVETLPNLRRRLKRSQLWRLAALHRARKLIATTGERNGNHAASGRLLRRMVTALEQRTLPTLSLQEIFGRRIGSIGCPEKVFLLISHEDPWIEVKAASPSEMALRLAHLAQYEQIPLMEHYLAHKFAFPEAINPFLERSFDCYCEILSQALAGKDIYTVRHPYPLDFAQLSAKLQPILQQPAREPVASAHSNAAQ